MAQFEAFHPDVEVNGETVLSFVEAMDQGRDRRARILAQHGIEPEPGQWYPQQAWLDAFREIAETVGDMNLFMIGKAIIDHARFPPMNGLEDALNAIDVAYHMNHRLHGRVMYDADAGGMTEGIGHYRVESFDPDNQRAVMICDNPYPSRFDEGIIAQVTRYYKPGYRSPSVALNPDRESRKWGGESCTYIIEW